MEFLVVADEADACPYLPGQTSRLPLRLPLAPVPPARFDDLLDEGDRRVGPFLYRTGCDSCRACEPLRIPVERFAATGSQEKVRRRNRDVVVEVGAPELTARHLAIYDRHRTERGLARDGAPISAESYRLQFLETCVDTVEVRYRVDGRLVAFSLLDLGDRAASSVYHCFDPDESRRSLGVFSVLAELAWCAGRGLDWYYLGFWVGACRSLAYKATYFPHQRRIRDAWVEFDGPA